MSPAIIHKLPRKPEGTRRSNKIIAIDPGEKAGIALFKDGFLSYVQMAVAPVSQGWVWRGPENCVVVVEVPQKYTGSPVDMQNLITLATNAGYLVGAMRPAKVVKVLPRDWKGQRPKTVDNHYTMNVLNDRERQILEECDVPRNLRHNIIDAVGIGLWYLRRRK